MYLLFELQSIHFLLCEADKYTVVYGLQSTNILYVHFSQFLLHEVNR